MVAVVAVAQPSTPNYRNRNIKSQWQERIRLTFSPHSCKYFPLQPSRRVPTEAGADSESGTELVKTPRGRREGAMAITESRIEAIAATLRDGSFRNGVTLPGFAKAWSLSAHRVAELSAEASKRVRAEVAGDHDRIAAKGFAMLERIADEAIVGCDDKGNNAGHLAVAIKAVDTWITKSGVAAPAKSLVAVGSLDALTDEQLAAKKSELLARLSGKAPGGTGEK